MSYPTLSRPPNYPLDPDGELEDVILRSPTEAGYAITRPRFTRARRRWGVTYINLPDADVATLRTFEQTTLHNGADQFSWTHPVTGTFTVQLAAPIRYARTAAANMTNVSFVLQEV